METVLVTGGCGFIGSRITMKLLEKGYNVIVLDNFSRGSLDNINSVDFGNAMLKIEKKRSVTVIDCPPKLKIFEGDIRDVSLVNNLVAQSNYVFHEAATNINKSVKYPEESFDVNFKGAYNVFAASKKHNIKKLIFASSASVYGEPKKLPMNEYSDKGPITSYCQSKLACEYVLKALGIPHIILRYFNVYGAGQHIDAYYTSVINVFKERLINGDEPIIQGSGAQSMDFIHVDDIVRANIMALESHVVNDTFNVGSGTSTTVKDLAYKLIELMGKDVYPLFSPRDVLVSRRQADTERIETMLGFSPQVDLDEGLKEVLCFK